MNWTITPRANGLVERCCEHGVGHPSRLLTPLAFYNGVHGCDGCCAHSSFTALEESAPTALAYGPGDDFISLRGHPYEP